MPLWLSLNKSFTHRLGITTFYPPYIFLNCPTKHWTDTELLNYFFKFIWQYSQMSKSKQIKLKKYELCALNCRWARETWTKIAVVFFITYISVVKTEMPIHRIVAVSRQVLQCNRATTIVNTNVQQINRSVKILNTKSHLLFS